jgi:hypothetical protein
VGEQLYLEAATYTGQHKHRRNADRHRCLEWDSNPRSQCLNGRRQHGIITCLLSRTEFKMTEIQVRYTFSASGNKLCYRLRCEAYELSVGVALNEVERKAGLRIR